MRVAAVLVVGDAGGGVHVELHGVARRQLQQDANIGKRAISQLQNWIRQRVSSAWGIQTGPFAAH